MKKWCFLLSVFPAVLFAADPVPKIPQPLPSAQIAAVDNLGPTAQGFQSVGEFGPEDEDQVDPRILRDFIESRGLIECRKKSGRLTIAGDVRARWIATGEEATQRIRIFDPEGDKFDRILVKKRGQGTNTAINRFKSEFNLFLDYVDKKSWVSNKIRWTTFDGIDGGSATKTEIDRAFIGYDVYEKGPLDFYVEIGRSHLDYIFDSRVEFGSVFDGIHLYYTNKWNRVGTFVAHGGPFIVDSFTNHYGWVVETYVENWADTGLIFKYSLINWGRHAPTQRYGGSATELGAIKDKGAIIDNPRYRFLISQLAIEYEDKIDFAGCKTLYLYAAVLANHDAKRVRQTDDRYRNKAGYVGFTLGKLCKACDWSLDVCYQYVQAQAVPEFDLTGIGHGNADNYFFSDAVAFNIDPEGAIGFTNFQGIQVALLYALTDNLSFRVKGDWSRPINPGIGGNFLYKAFEMSTIYAF